jgi:purine-binding chemotaxis protein CheW
MQTTGRDARDEQVVVFHLADDLFGFRVVDVGEIIRLPNLANMPLTSRSLMGLANRRGAVLPVVSLRRLVALPDAPIDDATRVIVIDRGVHVGFAVDRIDNLFAVSGDRIEQSDASAGAVDPDLLNGAVMGAEGAGTIKILDPRRLLRNEFAPLATSGSRAATSASVRAATTAGTSPAAQERQVSLVAFDLARQEYALPLDQVREIIPLPDHISEVPRAETAVLGVMTLRGRLLPLVSLRALLGLPTDFHGQERGKIIVLSMGNSVVGLVADRTREILRVDPAVIDPAPALLTRGAGDAEITSICRLDSGKRLIAILSPDRLFRSDLVSRLSEQAGGGNDPENQTDGDAMAGEQFIVFRLGDQEYGLPIAAVHEIARPPDRITRLPRIPEFIDGVMNLRGIVVPIVDLRRKFGLEPRERGSGQRILVLGVGGMRTGFLVDGVSEVMKTAADAIGAAPDLSPAQMRLIGRVVTLGAQDRMILLIDPAHLLDQVESDVLAKFDRSGLEQASRVS